ncbi:MULTISPECIES: hypothetical protein [unclassified Dolichospermum]|uniref:hypothetical protein n=1 Tax=unclassified Dolichospermum TaxID=2622029 RepID=UPI0014486B2F|nr:MULTISPECIES: hypothetical protein [unclassified Dolichospermum]MTJ15845.1 hypothetical protein [Dolichospermum sp. UHCC 0299]MTJ41614.1 hypothetical protein [Dolichospermum sp. UHCC 0406]
MSTLINNKNRSINRILFAVLTSFLYFSITIDKALSGGGDTTQSTTSTTEQASVTSPAVQNPGSVTVTPTTLLQTGSNNYANVNSNAGSLNPPTCFGTCVFGIMRTIPTNNINDIGGNQIEGVFGFIHSFSSPDKTNAETNRQLVNIQKQRSESEIGRDYIKMIADACQAKDLFRAELTAKGLARIWNVDYKGLSCGA